MSIPISLGSGAASVAAEAVSGLQYQQVQVTGKGGASTLGVNPDGTFSASIVGVPNVNATGSVIAIRTGTQITSIVSTVPSSVLVGASIFGALPGGNNVLGAVAASISGIVNVAGSVAGFAQSTNASVITVNQSSSVITVWQSSSVLAVPVGSVITVWQAPSIVGTYAEDAAHTTGEKGLFMLGVRNDNLTSVTSASGDYSPLATDPTGAVMAHDAPITKWVQGTADLRVVLGASVTAIAAQGASVFTYIQSAQLANMGSASVLVTFGGGLGSILGYSIAPAGGGSNIIFRPALKTGENSAFTASINGTASVLVSAQGFTAGI